MSLHTITVGRRHAGQTLAAVLPALFGLSRRDIEHFLKNRWVRLNDVVCRNPGQRVRAGQRLQVAMPRQGKTPPGKRLRTSRVRITPKVDGIRVVYADDAIVVIDKPAGLTTVRHADETKKFGNRAQRFLPATLVDVLPSVRPEFRQGRIRAVHRLDKDTSGLVVLARTADAESRLGKQFRFHEVNRTYLALVRGQAIEECIETHLVPDRGDGRRGSGAIGAGQRAVTHVRVVEMLGDFTLVECRLETGRTHQVRIHLGERGTPLCGERIYDRPPHGQPRPDGSGAKRPMLHAATLGLTHPSTGARCSWQAEMPADMATLLKNLRQRG